MTHRAAPSAVDYSHLLPLGVKGTSKGRTFQPNNGATFSSSNNIIVGPKKEVEIELGIWDLTETTVAKRFCISACVGCASLSWR